MSREITKTDVAVAESLALRGDISGLSPENRIRYYLKTCKDLGLNPSAQPFAFLRLNGKEVMYPTRGATDQLARIHGVNREITDGPKIIDLGGAKILFAVCRASIGQRVETATAAVPLPAGAENICNAVMKTETKARRRATLAILGLALLDESELDTIPSSQRVDLGAPAVADLERVAALPESTTEPATITRETLDAMDASREAVRAAEDRAFAPPPAEPADLVADIEVQVGRCGSVAQLVDLWIAARADVAAAPKAAQTRAWKLVGQRAEVIGSSAGAVRAEITRRDVPPRDDGPNGGAPKPAAHDAAGAHGSAQDTTPAQGALAMVPAWCCDVETMERHIEGYAHAIAIERCARKHRGGLPRAARELLALRYQRLSWDPHDGEVTIESARRLVATWTAQGPVERVRPVERAKIAAGGAR